MDRFIVVLSRYKSQMSGAFATLQSLANVVYPYIILCFRIRVSISKLILEIKVACHI